MFSFLSEVVLGDDGLMVIYDFLNYRNDFIMWLLSWPINHWEKVDLTDTLICPDLICIRQWQSVFHNWQYVDLLLVTTYDQINIIISEVVMISFV